jgi:DNA-binding transcriptional MerR regulator
MSEHSKLKPKSAVAGEFGVSTRTIDRWHRDEKLGFPAPIVINRRNYFSADALDQFKLTCARRRAVETATA